jgi:hypothetical protein
LFVDFVGEKTFPHTIVGIGFKGYNLSDADDFIRRFDCWKEYWNNLSEGSMHDWKQLAKMLIPPILFAKGQRLTYNKSSNSLRHSILKGCNSPQNFKAKVKEFKDKNG